MNEQRIQILIKALKKEISDSALDDPELLDIIDQLEADIEKKSQESGGSTDNMNDTVLALEAKLSSNHPVATRVIEELIDILANMGI